MEHRPEDILNYYSACSYTPLKKNPETVSTTIHTQHSSDHLTNNTIFSNPKNKNKNMKHHIHKCHKDISNFPQSTVFTERM